MSQHKILVIEDEKNLGETLSYMIAVNNFCPVIAETGQQALAVLETEDIHFILCDINLPDISGYEILEEIKRNSRLQHIPFVFLTAYGDDADRKMGLELGADNYLVKPFSTKELIKVIQSYLMSVK